MTRDQEILIDAKLAELAHDIADNVVPVFDFEVEYENEPWYDAEIGEKYHSEQVYSTNQGPAAAIILWEDLASRAELEDLEQPEWADEYCDDLASQVTTILGERFPDSENVFAYWDDNCLFVVVSGK